MSALQQSRMLAATAGYASDDAVLLERARAGDRPAFEELVRQYDQAVLRLALHLTASPEDAQDIYQEAFLRAYRNLPSFRFQCSFYTWIYRIVTNLCLDRLRRKKIRAEYPATRVGADGEEYDALAAVADPHPDSDPARRLWRRELAERIRRALEELSPRERLVFELRHYQGLRLATIATALQTSEAAAKNCLFRATRKLRLALQDTL